jgi:hypothetical protein
MEDFGKLLITLGVIFLVVGTILVLLPKLNLPLGNLPGDIKIERDNLRIYIPIASSILISVVLTLLLNLMVWILGRR